jgi:hypothetical protein
VLTRQEAIEAIAGQEFEVVASAEASPVPESR